MAEKRKIKRRTQEEIIAEIDQKIAFHKDKITVLETKKQELLTRKPKSRKSDKTLRNELMNQAAKKGITPAEIAEKLGLEL